MSQLSHFDKTGQARMVNVGKKPATDRVAVAGCRVRMQPDTLRLITGAETEKGDVFGVARIAGIMGAKKTSELIPLCHPVSLSSIDVQFTPDAGASEVVIEATARAYDRTGVEMEALVAVSTAALTIYDMCKSHDRAMSIEGVRLLEKSGGRSGHYRAPAL